MFSYLIYFHSKFHWNLSINFIPFQFRFLSNLGEIIFEKNVIYFILCQNSLILRSLARAVTTSSEAEVVVWLSYTLMESRKPLRHEVIMLRSLMPLLVSVIS